MISVGPKVNFNFMHNADCKEVKVSVTANLLKPLKIAFKGKGPLTLFKRLASIGQRYGLGSTKMDQALTLISQMMHEYDSKATLPITAVALARNGALVRRYQSQGIEFAVHGYVHVDYSQLSFDEQLDHFQKARQIFETQQIEFQGFRCPYLRANDATVAGLHQTQFLYDSTPSLYWPVVGEAEITESYRRALDFYGAHPVNTYPSLPQIDFDNEIVRIPYSLPDDESLIERVNWASLDDMNSSWVRMFEHSYEHGELFNLGLHPERATFCATALHNALEAMKAVQPHVWRANLGQIASWWRTRFDSGIKVDSLQNGKLSLQITGPPGTTLLLRHLEADVPTKPWFGEYKRAEGLDCILETERRPFIGISPDTPLSVSQFLRQQGYIVEIATESSLYSHYIVMDQFGPENQRTLLNELEAQDFPLARLSRWPYGTKSALCITGDIDGLTIWDYAMRFLGQ